LGSRSPPLSGAHCPATHPPLPPVPEEQTYITLENIRV